MVQKVFNTTPGDLFIEGTGQVGFDPGNKWYGRVVRGLIARTSGHAEDLSWLNDETLGDLVEAALGLHYLLAFDKVPVPWGIEGSKSHCVLLKNADNFFQKEMNENVHRMLTDAGQQPLPVSFTQQIADEVAEMNDSGKLAVLPDGADYGRESYPWVAVIPGPMSATMAYNLLHAGEELHKIQNEGRLSLIHI